MATSPILNIDTLIRRETVRIDGVAYELRTSGELTLFELARLERTADRVHAIDTTAEPSVAETAEYAALLDRAVRIILDAPEAVHAKLLTAHREAILWTFIGLSQPRPGLTRGTTEARPATASRRTTERSARGSRASTAARRVSG